MLFLSLHGCFFFIYFCIFWPILLKTQKIEKKVPIEVHIALNITSVITLLLHNFSKLLKLNPVGRLLRAALLTIVHLFED